MSTGIHQATLKGTRQCTELSFRLELTAGESRGKRKELSKERQKRAGNGVWQNSQAHQGIDYERLGEPTMEGAETLAFQHFVTRRT